MERKHQNLSVLIPVIVSILLVVVFCLFFFGISGDIQETTHRELLNVSMLQINAFDAGLNGLFDLLYSSASNILPVAIKNDSLHIFATNIANNSNFDVIGVANADGEIYTSNNSSFSITDYQFFQQSLIGKTYIQRINSVLGSDMIVMSVPIYDDSTIVGILFGAIKIIDFETAMHGAYIDQGTYSFLVDKFGNVVVPSVNEYNIHTDNIFNVYDFDGVRISDADLRSKLLIGKSGVFKILIDNSERYVAYHRLSDKLVDLPDGADSWYIFTSVPSKLADLGNSLVMNRVATLSIELIFIALSCVIYFVLDGQRKSRIAKQELDDIKSSEEVYRIVNDISDNVLFYADPTTQIISFNNRYEKLFHRQSILHTYEDLKKDNPYIYPYDVSAYRNIIDCLIAGEEKASAEFRIRNQDGVYDWYKAVFVTIYNSDNQPAKVIGKLTNVQEEHTYMENLTKRAESDMLTGLNNHITTREKVDAYLANSKTNDISAFLYIDFDNFKTVNDTLGHIKGDELLVLIAEKMCEIFRNSDILGRLGGDEFCAFVKNFEDEKSVYKKAQIFINGINSLKFGDTKTSLNCSIGVAIAPKDGKDFNTLYACADKALYKAKNIKNCYIAYNPTDTEQKSRRVSTEIDD